MLRRAPKWARMLSAVVAGLLAGALIWFVGFRDDGTSGGGDPVPLAGGSTTSTSAQQDPAQEAYDRECIEVVEPPVDPPGTTVTAMLEPVTEVEVAGEVAFPSALVAVPDTTDRFLVGRRDGLVAEVGGEATKTVLDLRSDTSTERDQGLLELRYGPEGDWFYVLRTDGSGATLLTAHPVRDGIPGEEGTVEVLEVEQPGAHHNGGGLAFAPDGTLFVSIGEGGEEAGDPDLANAREPDLLLGKILRIEPTPQDDEPYRIPEGNPSDGAAGPPEVWASGVRNAFRLHVDPSSGDLWVADTGQACSDELNLIPAGESGRDLGWDAWEGNMRFRLDREPEPHHPPVYAYHHGCVAVGGYVYEGEAIPGLRGAFLAADWCAGWLRAFWVDERGLRRVEELVSEVERPIAVVPDAAGEPLVLSSEGSVERLAPGT